MKLFKDIMFRRWKIATLASLHFYGYPSKKLKIVGITGTNGKTTIATTLYSIATALGHKSGLIGTIENRIGDEIRPTKNTTPGPLELNALLKEMVVKGCEYVFMEVSSHAIDQRRIAGIKFTGGIFTNITHDHLDYHKTFENYFRVKKSFFDHLSRTAFALSNTDDERGVRMLDNTKALKKTYGLNSAADFKGDIAAMDFSGITMTINSHEIHVPLIGKFNAYNMLAVYGACELLEFDKNKVAQVLHSIIPPAGRFEYFYGANGSLGVVDFAHSPDSLENIIKTARQLVVSGGRVISIFGCGGDKDPMKRSVMGKIGASLSDIALFTADNPRSEDPAIIIEAMCANLTPEELVKVQKFPDRTLAITEAGKIAQKGDIILLMGKGPETYQEIKGVKHPWSDREKLEQALT